MKKSETRCPQCAGTGFKEYSCCGDDITFQIPEDDTCPTCHEHCGFGDSEICEYCAGTGYRKNLELGIIRNINKFQRSS